MRKYKLINSLNKELAVEITQRTKWTSKAPK
jgi:hypothetical protein